MACSLPVAGSLKASFPECEITWICSKSFAALPQQCRHVKEVVIADKKIGALKKQIENLGEFDFALDIQGLLKSALPVAFAKAKKKLGYHWQREGSRFFSQPVIPAAQSIHIVEQYADVARAIGGSDKIDFGLGTNSESDQIVDELLRNLDNQRKVVVCHGGAGWATKRWPAKNFAQLNDYLTDKANVIFIGTTADQLAFNEIKEFCKVEPISFLTKTNVSQLISLLSRADLHVAGDTGSIHIAAALGTPCIGLFTLTKPQRSCPYGQLQNCLSLDLTDVSKLADSILSS